MYDIMKDYRKPFPGEQPFFTDFLGNLQSEDPTIGINGVRWNQDLYPHLYLHKDRLVERFNEKYQFREIGAETVSRWMALLQDRFDDIAPRFDHAYKLYDDEAINLDALGLGYVKRIIYSEDVEGTASNAESQELTGSDSRTTSSTRNTTGANNSKFRDTPTDGNSTINNPTTEQNDTSSGQETGSGTDSGSNTRNIEGSSTGNTTQGTEGEREEIYDYHDEHTMEEVNKLVDRFKSLDNEFVYQFNQMFIGIMTILE